MLADISLGRFEVEYRMYSTLEETDIFINEAPCNRFLVPLVNFIDNLIELRKLTSAMRIQNKVRMPMSDPTGYKIRARYKL